MREIIVNCKDAKTEEKIWDLVRACRPYSATRGVHIIHVKFLLNRNADAFCKCLDSILNEE